MFFPQLLPNTPKHSSTTTSGGFICKLYTANPSSHRENPVFITGNPVLIAGMGFQCTVQVTDIGPTSGPNISG